MKNKMIDKENFTAEEQRKVIKRRIYKPSYQDNFESVQDTSFSPYTSIVDLNTPIPNDYIVIEQIEALNSTECYYMVYFVIFYKNYIITDTEVLGFSSIDYEGYDDSHLKSYLQGIVSTINSISS